MSDDKPKMMKILNKSDRSFTTAEGVIKKNALVEVSAELGAKLTRMYKGELVDVETAAAPFKAEAEKPEPQRDARTKTPKQGTAERTAKEKGEADKADAKAKKERAQAERAFAAEAKEKGVTVEVLTKMKRSDELLAKTELTEAEANELKALEADIDAATKAK